MAKKNKTIKKFVHYLEYGALRIIGMVLMVMPLKIMYLVAEVLGSLTFHVFRIRRDVTMENLRNALGNEYSEPELKRIAYRAYVNIGKTFIEMLVVTKFGKHVLDMVDIPDLPILNRNIARGSGIIFVSCHFGSWELIGVSLVASGIPVTVVGKRQSNPHVDRLINRSREKMGMKVISHGASIKHIIGALRKRGAIGLVSDQDAGRDGIFIDFFGRKASTPRGAAQLALKYNAPILVLMSVRTGNGRYQTIIKEIDFSENDSIESITQRYTKVMEDIIRQYPEQYFWMHRRWKTIPK